MGGGVGGIQPPTSLSFTVPKCLTLESLNVLNFNTYLWIIVCTSFFIHRPLCYHDNTFIEQRTSFILFDKIDMTYEIKVSELTPPSNFSLIPVKIKRLSKIPS